MDNMSWNNNIYAYSGVCVCVIIIITDENPKMPERLERVSTGGITKSSACELL